MAVILSDDNINFIIDRLSASTTQIQRDLLIESLEAATDAPDDIDLIRTIKDSGARKRSHIAQAIVAEYFDD
jgi:hypothetical protein